MFGLSSVIDWTHKKQFSHPSVTWQSDTNDLVKLGSEHMNCGSGCETENDLNTKINILFQIAYTWSDKYEIK